MASREYDVPVTKTDEEKEYPQHVKDKLKAYEDAGLKYRINQDSIMKRSIIFNIKKRMFESTYQMTVRQMWRLRDPVSGKEHILYDTYEKVTDDANQKFEDNISYGIREYIEADPVTDKVTGNLIDKEKTVHNNIYTIEYDAKKVRKILQEQHDPDHEPMLFVGFISKKAGSRWSGENKRIKNLSNFITADFDSLMLMALTKTNTVDDAKAAAETIKGDRMIAQNMLYKEDILQYARNIDGKATPK